MRKRILMSVINDLVTDQRVDKMCRSLHQMGFDVTVCGRRKTDSPSLPPRSYKTVRLHLLFEKGPLFYIEFQIRLFLYFLTNPADLLIANDLDTLLPGFLASKIKGIPLVYDSHEYFTGVPELEGRAFVRGVWKATERFIIPRLTDIITVNDSIANLYKEEYGKKLHVIRNVPEQRPAARPDRKELGLPEEKSLLLLQGAGINIDRGAEEVVEAMQYLEGVVLLIIGSGDVLPKLRIMTEELALAEKVIFIPRQAFENLIRYTLCADIGLTLDKDTNINYRFSLPNKLFDYIQAGVPVLASPLPEVSRIVRTYDIGRVCLNHDPRHLAQCVREMLDDKDQMAVWKENLIIAAQELTWEKEALILHEIYGKHL